MVQNSQKLAALCLCLFLFFGFGKVGAASNGKAVAFNLQTGRSERNFSISENNSSMRKTKSCKGEIKPAVKKIKTEEDAVEYLREYLVRNVPNGKNLVLKVNQNSRADGPGMWSIEIDAGEDHPDHFVTIAHYRVSSDGTIEELNIYNNHYENVRARS